MKNPCRSAAFSLIELLVVIGIIAVLLGLLLPGLNRMREIGNRAKCASNLHNFGTVCYAFANDYDGVFPVNYMMTDPKFPYRFPLVFPADIAREADPDHPDGRNELAELTAVGRSRGHRRLFQRLRACVTSTARPRRRNGVRWSGRVTCI